MILEFTKLQILTPEKYDEHLQYFHLRVPPGQVPVRLTLRTHPVVTLQLMHAESYDINVRFLVLLWSPSLDIDSTNPAAEVPSLTSWK